MAPLCRYESTRSRTNDVGLDKFIEQSGILSRQPYGAARKKGDAHYQSTFTGRHYV